MPFLDYNADFSEMTFTQADLEFARNYFVAKISEVSKNWLIKPQGRLGRIWRTNGVFPLCQLIYIAKIFAKVEFAVTPRSLAIVQDKFAYLLRCSDANQFEELITEISVEAMFAEAQLIPLEIDPSVPIDKLKGSDRPPTCEFSVLHFEGAVNVEITVPGIGHLDKWDARLQHIQQRFSDGLGSRGVSRQVLIQFPLVKDWNQFNEAWITPILKEMTLSPMGGRFIPMDKGVGHVQWEDVDIYPLDNPPSDLPTLNTQDLPSDYVIHVVRNKADGSWVAALVPPETVTRNVKYAMAPEDAALIVPMAFKSLGNSLKNKRRQCIDGEPFIIVIRIWYHEFIAQQLMTYIKEEIFKKKDFDWLSAIWVYEPAKGFQKSIYREHITMLTNTNAETPLPQTFLERIPVTKEKTGV